MSVLNEHPENEQTLTSKRIIRKKRYRLNEFFFGNLFG